MMDLDILPYDIRDRDEFWEGGLSNDYRVTEHSC